nr:uncharacterized protein LOC109781178 [Aegilops tauschii subsp. strangulata]
MEKAEADKAEAAALKKLAVAEADAAAKKLAEEAARRQAPLFVIPLNSAPPPTEFTTPTGGAGDEEPVMEREGSDVVMPEVVMPPPPPSGGAQDKQTAAPPAPPAGNEMVTGPTPEARTPSRRRGAKAASAPRPLEAGAARSSVPDAEPTSVAPTEWVRGGGTGALNQAILDVQARLRAKADTLKQWNKVFLDSRAAIRDYHNVRAITFNSNIRDLDRRTADLLESRNANAALQQQLGEANTVLRAKEAEVLPKAEEEEEVKESSLLTEFETECSTWTDKEALLTAGFGRIEDMLMTSFLATLALPTRLLRLVAKNEGRKEELVAVERDLVRRAAASTEYTNTSIFIPELAENGAEAPPEWFGLNPEDDEDSAEMIDSSDEGEGEEDEEGEEDMPEVVADSQPQLDRASNNEPCSSAPTAAGGDQAETDLPSSPPTGTTDSANQPDPSAAP